MAYLFHDPQFAGAAASCDGARAGAPLSPIEAQVVELALADGPSTLATARWRRGLAALFGLRPARPLASPRLETLRRFVVLTRYARAAAAKEMTKLLGLGFTIEQLCAIQQRIAAVA